MKASMVLPFYSLCWYIVPLVIHCALTGSSKEHPEWTKAVLTHHWPVTVCMTLGSACKTPPKINYWTLHGLWPNNGQMCNSSWPFEVDEIKSLLPDMHEFWPDVAHPNGTQFWKHEWEKHGTCAAVEESVNSEYKYFSKTLELYKKLDLNSVLKKYNIVPSSSFYQMNDIRNAIVTVFGVNPKIQCIPPDEEESAQILGQIEICFNQEFQPVDCVHEKSTEDNFPHFDKLLSYEYDGELHPELSVCSDQLNTYYPPVEGFHK